MDRLELEKTLRDYTGLEKLFRQYPSSDLYSRDLTELTLTHSGFFDFLIPENDMAGIRKLPEKLDIFDDKWFIPQDESIMFLKHPRFVETQMHRHSFIEMVYVFSGSCTQIINNKRITMNKGDLCILDTNTYHSIQRVGEDDIIINCLMKKSYFDAAFISRLSENNVISSFFIHAIYQAKNFNGYILFKSNKTNNIHEIIEKILCEYCDKKACFKEVINSYMIILFAELLRSYEKSVNEENYEALNNTSISDIILYIRQNCKSCTLVSTAKHFNFHPNYLSRILKKFSNRTFTDLKNEARLEMACALLKNTSFKIDRIADEIGYSNIHFFYKIFKNKYGMTPAEYRRRHDI